MSLRHNTGTKGSEEEVNRLCQLYPEIASWQPALITGAWNQWRAENPHLRRCRKNVTRRFPVPRQAYPQQNGGDERMALISCFTGPQGLQGMLTCLRDTEGMTGILVVVALLAGWIVVQHLQIHAVNAVRGRAGREYPSLWRNLAVPDMPMRFMPLLTGNYTVRCFAGWKTV